MSRFSKRLMAMALLAAGTAAQAATVYNYDTVATGATPNSAAPWLTATLEDGTSNDVNGMFMQLDVSLEDGGEFVRTLLFNLDGDARLGNVYQTGGSSIVDWTYRSNRYTGGGQGNFKFDLKGEKNDHTLAGLNTWTFFFAGLNEEDFWNTNGSGWWTMAHVQGITGNGNKCSGWIGDNSGVDNAGSGEHNVTDTSCTPPPEVPLPGTLGLLGLGLAGLGAIRRRKVA